jgi:hypothetical protein
VALDLEPTVVTLKCSGLDERSGANETGREQRRGLVVLNVPGGDRWCRVLRTSGVSNRMSRDRPPPINC